MNTKQDKDKDIRELTERQAKIALLAIREGKNLTEALEIAKTHINFSRDDVRQAGRAMFGNANS